MTIVEKRALYESDLITVMMANGDHKAAKALTGKPL